MKRHQDILWRSARWTWVALAVFLLIVYVGTYNPGPHRDNDIVLSVLMMIALGFPLSWIGVFTLCGVIMLLDGTRLAQATPTQVALTLQWMVLFAFGYAQWFVLVPRIWREVVARVNAKKRSGDAEGAR